MDMTESTLAALELDAMALRSAHFVVDQFTARGANTVAKGCQRCVFSQRRKSLWQRSDYRLELGVKLLV